jgi:hypothetical protein
MNDSAENNARKPSGLLNRLSTSGTNSSGPSGSTPATEPDRTFRRLSPSSEQALLWILDNCKGLTRENLKEMMLMLEDLNRREVSRLLLQRIETGAPHYHIASNEVFTAPKVRAIIREVGGL